MLGTSWWMPAVHVIELPSHDVRLSCGMLHGQTMISTPACDVHLSLTAVVFGFGIQWVARLPICISRGL